MKGANGLVVAVVVLGMAFLAMNKFDVNQGLFSLVDEAVWCNVLEYQTCYMHKDFSGTANLIPSTILFNAEKTFTCGYDECRLTGSSKPSAYFMVNGARITLPKSMYFGDNLKLGDALSGNSVDVYYDAYNRRLDWCGTSPCSNGIAVSGSDKCTFTTNKAIYGGSGQLLRNPASSEQSYTVPTDNSIQLVNGQQFICGTKYNQCVADADCAAGHTYLYNGLGAEASGGSLQVYGCVSGGTAPTAEQKDVTQQERSGVTSTSFNYGNRCQGKSNVTVQCIPGTVSCGSNSVCDVTTFTCKAAGEVKCTQDRDCGTGEVYDQPTKSYYNYICRDPNTLVSYCDRNLIRAVQCRYNSECAADSYCDIDGACKQSATNIKQPAPGICSVGDPRYFDKPAPAGNVCCPGGQSYAPTNEQCTGGGSGTGGLGIFEMIVIVLLLIAAITIVPKLLGLFGK